MAAPPWTRFRRQVIPFGEKVWFQPPAGKRGGLDARFLSGVFIGLTLRTDECIIGTAAGALKARSVRRLPLAQRADGALLLSLRCSVWQPTPGVAGPRGYASIVAPPAAAAGDIPAPVVPRASAAQGPRRFCIRRDHELIRYGLTAGCPGCTATERMGPPAARFE